MYGKQGCGKSMIINLIIDYLIKQVNGIVFTIKEASELERYINFVPDILRIIEPDRPIITIIEDVDGIVERSANKTLLLNILDGLEQMERVIYLCTTNYPEKLQQNLLNRPSRFDIRIEIKPPTPKVRKFYFEHKFKEHPEDLQKVNIKKWVEVSEGFTMAHLREMILSVMVYEHSLEETVKRLKSFEEIPNSVSFGKDSSSEIGFKKYSDDEKYCCELDKDEIADY